MGKAEEYREILRASPDWLPYLLQESGLPGPRGNLELIQAVADEGIEQLFLDYISYSPSEAPTNDPKEFLVCCGAVGLGRLAAEGNLSWLDTLRKMASDPRWRTREAVAMALQRLGKVNMPVLLQEMALWSRGNMLEQRAAAAALCEPVLLKKPSEIEQVLKILDDITALLQEQEDRKSDEFQALRKGLAYCWSVAVAALPDKGKPMLEKWLVSADRDIRWIMKENLKKNRLVRIDPKWAAEMLMKLETS
ncbi:MAG: hypothetical protein P4L50_28120 [Anaerolineaceae bacterium]|nr:hypothetical protein [Anaerolineaceae bacterium]